MFELHKAKTNEVKDIRWVVFHPEDHELRFYQFMFPIREHQREDGIRDYYEIKINGRWKQICIWEMIYRDEDGKLGIYRRPYWHSRWEYEEEVHMSSFDCVEWIIFQDDEWDMFVATSRSTSWNVYETFFINEYQRLLKENDGNIWSWFYDELEKRTFTHIEYKPFLDLTTC